MVWSELQPSSFVSTDGATLTRDDKGIILATGTNPAIDNYVISTEVVGSTVWSAIRLDLFPHDSLPASGPGRCKNGNLHLSEVSVAIFEPGSSSGKATPIARASADFNQSGWSIDRAIDGNTMTAWGIHPEVGKQHHAIFVFAEQL